MQQLHRQDRCTLIICMLLIQANCMDNSSRQRQIKISRICDRQHGIFSSIKQTAAAGTSTTWYYHYVIERAASEQRVLIEWSWKEQLEIQRHNNLNTRLSHCTPLPFSRLHFTCTPTTYPFKFWRWSRRVDYIHLEWVWHYTVIFFTNS